MGFFFIFRLHITSWARFSIWIKIIFQWKGQSLIFFFQVFCQFSHRWFFSSLHSRADAVISRITENKNVSSINSLILDEKLSNISLIKIRNQIGPNIDACRTPALTLVQIDTWPLRISICFLLFKKTLKMFVKPPEMPFCSSLKIYLCARHYQKF